MNTALNRTILTNLTNKSGGALELGDVVIIDTANSSAITVTATADYITTFPGVVIEPTGIAIDENGQVAFSGYVDQINLSIAANIGDKIATAAVNKLGLPSAVSTRGTFGIALEAGTTPKALLLGLSTYSPDAGTVDPGIFNAKLSITTGTIIYDVYTGTTLYLSPYNGESISVYNTGTTVWETLTLSNVVATSLSGLITGTNYDVFVYQTGSAAVLDFVAWSNNTTRAIELGQQNNIDVHPSQKNKRYVGTIRTIGIGATADWYERRFVWNLYNRDDKPIYRRESVSSWNYTSAAWRPANNNLANRIEVVTGKPNTKLNVTVGMLSGGAGNNGVGMALGEDSTTTIIDDFQIGSYLSYAASVTQFVSGHVNKLIPVGFHYYQWLEFGQTGMTFYGYITGSSYPGYKTGISGFIG